MYPMFSGVPARYLGVCGRSRAWDYIVIHPEGHSLNCRFLRPHHIDSILKVCNTSPDRNLQAFIWCRMPFSIPAPIASRCDVPKIQTTKALHDGQEPDQIRASKNHLPPITECLAQPSPSRVCWRVGQARCVRDESMAWRNVQQQCLFTTKL